MQKFTENSSIEIIIWWNLPLIDYYSNSNPISICVHRRAKFIAWWSNLILCYWYSIVTNCQIFISGYYKFFIRVI